EGTNLALSDVDEAGLHETAELIKGVKLTTHILDVAKREAVYDFAEKVIAEHGSVQIVINNAGVAMTANMQDITYEEFEWIMNINFWGMVYGSKAFLPHLLQQPKSWLANVSSIFGIITSPTQGAYNVSKFAIRAFTEALRQEMQETNLVVSSIHPGGIDTPIVQNGRYNADSLSEADNQKQIRDFPKVARTSAEEAAKVIMQGLKKEKKRILIGKDARYLDRMQRLMPIGYERILDKIRKKVQGE
ncbi:MAG: SDR family oxidoreductase, partial [Bacteroidota bacterium]